jgi:hypothetical protein
VEGPAVSSPEFSRGLFSPSGTLFCPDNDVFSPASPAGSRAFPPLLWSKLQSRQPLKVCSIEVEQVIGVVHNGQHSPFIECSAGMRYSAANLIADPQMLAARTS